VCLPPGPRHATITRLDLAGAGLEVVARGVRNSVGFDFQPETASSGSPTTAATARRTISLRTS